MAAITIGLWTATGLLVLLTALPMVALPHGVFRTPEFPRLQFACFGFGILILGLLFAAPGGWTAAMLIAVAACVAYHLSYILRFTPVFPVTVQPHAGGGSGSVRLLICNVKQANERKDLVAALFAHHTPDIAIFMETNAAWAEALAEAAEDLPFRLLCPLDNSYGMVLFSRLEMLEGEVKSMLTRRVPSFHCRFRLASGETVRLIAIHPEPPAPADDTIGRDAEIALVARMVESEQGPVIVTGDLNDVAWSPTTRRFLRLSHLLDPREGRALINSFDARYPFLRWPLDHVFHSAHFHLKSISRLPFVGSDHFPILCKLVLAQPMPDTSDQPVADSADRKETQDLIAIERNRSRAPRGEDWE